MKNLVSSSTMRSKPTLFTLVPHKVPRSTRITTIALQRLSWCVTLVFYPIQYIVTPVLRKLFGNIIKEGQAVDYTKYESNKFQNQDRQCLNTEISLRNGVKIRNHIVKAGITDGLCTVKGNPTTAMIRAYSRYSAGGYGMVISSDTSVDRRCRLPGVTGHTPIFDSQSDRKAYGNLIKEMKKHGHAILQLTHPGPIVPFSDKAYGPSEIRSDSPRTGLCQYTNSLTDKEIDQIFKMFLSSARQAEEWGFNGVQLVASNGYLPALFLNPLINTNSRKWAGNTFVTKLIEALILQRKDSRFIISIKLNSTDFQVGGISSEKAVSLVEQISDLHVDFIEIGGGNCEQLFVDHLLDSPREKFFADFAKRILCSDKVQVPVMATGEWRNTYLMNTAVEHYPHLLIGLGRPTCIDPDVAQKILSGQIATIPNWFKEYEPPFVTKKLKTETKDAKRMAYGIEVAWHALAVSSIARGEKKPKVQGIFNNPLNALGIKIHMFIRAVLPRSFLSSYFAKHPLVTKL